MLKAATVLVGAKQSTKIFFQISPNTRQPKDRDDLAKAEALRTKLFEKIFPVWQQVADGPRKTTWTSLSLTVSTTAHGTSA